MISWNKIQRRTPLNGDLGSFRPTLKTRVWNEKKAAWVAGGTYTPNDAYDPENLDANSNPTLISRGVTADNIESIKVSFTRSAEMVKRLSRYNLKFRMVPGEKKYPVKVNG